MCRTETDRLCLTKLLEAIATKDEHSLVECLRTATIDTVLCFESTYGVSPLIWCVQTGDVSYLGLVRCLLSSGFYDSMMVDSKERSVLASAADLHTDNPAFVTSLIDLEIDGVDEATACYRMLRQNSLPLLKLYLSVKQHDEAKLFESLANALIQLNVKNVSLNFSLRVFVQWMLADYGYRHLSGDYKPPPEEATHDEWKKHIDIIKYIQLEMCEMLNTVGYFGDNFHYLKHRIPMIMGKSFRNLLAHDTLSYNLLTDSGDEKLVINAFILANTKLSLFDKPTHTVPNNLCFPIPENTYQWVEEQQRLLEAFRENDVEAMSSEMKAGAEIKSLFRRSPDPHYPQASHHLVLTNLIERDYLPESAMIQLLNRYFPSFESDYRRPELRMTSMITSALLCSKLQ
uniref:Uncharacterized protein n=1 Tax=Anopheles epiroticus TaxID=199890 RepID=A0A182PHM9_9DIPT